MHQIHRQIEKAHAKALYYKYKQPLTLCLYDLYYLQRGEDCVKGES